MVYVPYFKRSLLTVLSISVDGFRIKGPTIKKILLLEVEQTYYNPKKATQSTQQIWNVNTNQAMIGQQCS